MAPLNYLSVLGMYNGDASGFSQGAGDGVGLLGGHTAPLYSSYPFGCESIPIDQNPNNNGITAIAQDAATNGLKLMIAFPMHGGVDNCTVSYATVASGARDADALYFAQTLIANGCPDAMIRMGWEGNQANAVSDPAGSVAAVQRLTTVMRSAVGQQFQFVWNPTMDSGQLASDLILEYPGDAYVDLVCLDFYDNYFYTTAGGPGAPGSPYPGIATTWPYYLTFPAQGGTNNGTSLNWMTAFARAHGKKCGFCECGLGYSDSFRVSGGDDPAFENNLAEWWEANADVVKVIVLWNSGGSGFQSFNGDNLNSLGAIVSNLASTPGVHSMTTDVIAPSNSALVTAGGTTAPASGTSESWTVTTVFPFPVLGAGQIMRVMDIADLGKLSGYEVMLVTANANGVGASWTVTRGAEGTTPIAHTASWTVVPVVTPDGLDGRYSAINEIAGETVSGGPLTSDQTWIFNGSNFVPGPVEQVQVRTASATLNNYEDTIFTGSTPGQTLILPTAPTFGQRNVVTNYASVPVNIEGFVHYFGQGLFILTLLPFTSYVFLYAGSSIWYVVDSSTMDHPSVNAVAFGADPTGASDSASAINTAWGVLGGLDTGTVYLSPSPISSGGPSSTTYKINSTLGLANATYVETTVTSKSGTTLNVPSTAGFTASGTGAVFTASVTASTFTYTSKTSTSFVGCTGLPGSVTAGYAVTQGTLSTQNGLTLEGAGGPGVSYNGYLGYQSPSTRILWNGAAGGTMVSVAGPACAINVKNLYFDCIGANTAAIGVKITALNAARWDNVYVSGASGQGWYFNGVNGFSDGSLVVIGATAFCDFYSCGVTVGGGNGVVGVFLSGDTNGQAIGSANTTYCHFYNFRVSIGDPGSGNQNYAIYFQFCDDIIFRDLTIISPFAPVGTIYAGLYDYTTTASNCPMACVIDGIEVWGAVNWFADRTSQVASSPNIVTNLRAGFTNGSAPSANFLNPNVYNLRWNVSGGERVITDRVAGGGITSGTPIQLSPTDPVVIQVEETTSIAWALTYGPTSAGNSHVLKSSNNPGALSATSFDIPTGWFVVLTCATIADLTVSVVTRCGV